MKIKIVTATLHRLPLTKPYTIAYNTTSYAEMVLLTVILENGITGLGAANPFPDVVGEMVEQTLFNLRQPFVQELMGRDIRHFNRLIDEAKGYFPKHPGTLAAIDIALHDAFGQLLGIPVVDFYGRKQNALPTSFTIGIKDTATMLEEAASIYANGFRIVKMKTGINVEEDVERVTKLHEAFDNKIKIRVDANTGYNEGQLRYFLKQTEQLCLELVEQPLPVNEEIQLTAFTDAQRKILVADESLLDVDSAWDLSRSPQPYGVFNIKLMKCGGIKQAREIGALAALAGIDLFWGCNDESIISITAALHAAYSCTGTKYLDLDGSFDLSSDLVSGGFVVKDGYMFCSTEPGLGVKRLAE